MGIRNRIRPQKPLHICWKFAFALCEKIYVGVRPSSITIDAFRVLPIYDDLALPAIGGMLKP